MDSQLTEIIGRQRLIEELLAAGIEVAVPLRDRGIDLIAYLDRDLKSFVSVPIQLKASTKQAFGVDKKYLKTKGLVLAYVWNVSSPDKVETYAMTYGEAESIAAQMRWTRTASWKKGGYVTTKPSARLREILAQYRMSSDRWRKVITRAEVEIVRER